MILILFGIRSFEQVNSIDIPFLQATPVIDGLPDKELDGLRWSEFAHIEKSNVQNPEFIVQYKIAYNDFYLYLLIEANSDSIIIRDRAYQNGDGFHMVIARPDSGKPTNEFYVLRFSPANRSKNQTARKGVWYYNIDLSGKSLGPATQFECSSVQGKSYYELLLPWNEVYPYQPLFSTGIGINLCFVKAIGDKEKNFYYMKYDERIQWELNKREYLIANFGPPAEPENSYALARIQRKNMVSGNALKLKMISFSLTPGNSRYNITVRSADNYIYNSINKEIEVSKGMNTNEFILPVENLLPGGYKVVWRGSDNSEGEIPLTILPEINYEKEKTALKDLESKISRGDYNTLLFQLQNIIKDYKNVKEYETAGNVREGYLAYQRLTSDLQKNNHLLADRTGISRRAFLSKIDNSLQPYSINIPVNFDRNRKYPLFVMLHGSGSDDREMLGGEQLAENNFIEIAPYGRGTSNCFTADSAQVDVKEAIDDVIANYPIDTSKMIIAGFSMGGYGAYRIFYEYPHLFKGVIVFSGHPNLANQWLGEGYPDFLDFKYLKPFKNIPVFIYHSKNDLNCPYDLTEQLVGKLKKAGAKVEFVTTTEGGHGIMDKDHLSIYYQWLKNTIDSKTQ
jgi:predicted esterase